MVPSPDQVPAAPGRLAGNRIPRGCAAVVPAGHPARFERRM